MGYENYKWCFEYRHVENDVCSPVKHMIVEAADLVYALKDFHESTSPTIEPDLFYEMIKYMDLNTAVRAYEAVHKNIQIVDI